MVRPLVRGAGAVCMVLSVLALPATASGAPAGASHQVVSSSPPDRTVYSRAGGPRQASPLLPAGVATIDPVLLASTVGGGEPSIAINPANPKQIAITRFAFPWPGNTRMLYSADGGITWTDEATIPVPPGITGTSGCPCDQTLDWGRDGRLYGTFLTFTPASTQVVSGSTTDPTSAAAWSWNGSPAQLTSGPTRTQADQPQLLVNRDPTTAGQDNVYVAYDDFAAGPDARVAVSYGANPSNFTVDSFAGAETPLATNPGLRLAKDPTSGTMYALYQQSTGAVQPKNVTYRLNRSTDGGANWTLNGSSNGLVVDTVNSDQAPGFKFGTVNALLGGVDHAAVDPGTGDVYVVYGQDVSGGNQIKIRRVTGSGVMTVGAASNVSTSIDAALPSVAVLDNGTIGVLYITHDGTGPGGFHTFSAHLARSTDQGATFNDVVLQSFASPVLANANARQRIFGDYDQLKSVGNTFYGVYSGNRNGFGSSTSAIDPIFFSVPQATTTMLTSSANPSVFGQPVHFTATVTPVPDGGHVNFTVDGTPLGGNVAVNTTTGVATSPNISTLAIGNHTVKAVYSGDANFVGSMATLIQKVKKAPTTTTVTGVPNPSDFGSPVTFTAHVAPAPPSTNPPVKPTGTVNFSVDGTLVTTQPLNQPTGNASFSTASLLPGTHTIGAQYSGDSKFLGSTGSVTQAVTCINNVTGTVAGAVVVGAGSTCIINADVGGAVLSPTGGSGLFISNSTIGGGVYSTGASFLGICSSTISGGISIQDATGFVVVGDPGDDACGANIVLSGSVHLANNHGDVEIIGNQMPSLILSGTSGTGPFPEDTAAEIESNQIAGSVHCSGNTPAPTNDGNPNTVGGGKTGQCTAI